MAVFGRRVHAVVRGIRDPTLCTRVSARAARGDGGGFGDGTCLIRCRRTAATWPLPSPVAQPAPRAGVRGRQGPESPRGSALRRLLRDLPPHIAPAHYARAPSRLRPRRRRARSGPPRRRTGRCAGTACRPPSLHRRALPAPAPVRTPPAPRPAERPSVAPRRAASTHRRDRETARWLRAPLRPHPSDLRARARDARAPDTYPRRWERPCSRGGATRARVVGRPAGRRQRGVRKNGLTPRAMSEALVDNG